MTCSRPTGAAATLLAQRIHGAARARLAPEGRAGLAYLRVALPAPFGAVFTTRVGGVSAPPYASLNLAEHTGDDAGKVRQNRALLLSVLETGLPLDRLVTLRQEHTTRVVGAAEYGSVAAGGPADGLTFRGGLDEGMAGLLFYADCLPVILAGEVDVAVVHAGWRGLLDGVIQQAARAMTAPPGSAVLGPSIGPCCYEVDPDVAAAFTRRYGTVAVSGRNLDLWAAAERALAEVGVRAVTNPRLCTFCHGDLFFSHRRDGPRTGRQGALVWVAEE